MRIYGIKLTSANYEDFVLPLDSGIVTAKYVLRDADGLQPVSSGGQFGKSAGDGQDYLGRSRSGRKIVLTVGLQPDFSSGETVGALRDQLYKLFDDPGDTGIKVALLGPGLSSVLCQVTGWVETIEPNIFSADPEVVITINTESPFFSAPTSITYGPYDSATGVVINNPGNAKCGYVLKFTIATATTTLTINRVAFSTTDGSFKISGTGQVAAGDVFEISTVPGDRYVRRTRSGTTVTMLGYMFGVFPLLYPGDNNFSGSVAGIFTNGSVTWKIVPRYLGV